MHPSPVPHAPFGAQASFNLGPAGTAAGFALPAETPVTLNAVIGCRASQGEAWNLLPFYAPPPGISQPLPKGRFGRFLGWAGDKWMIGPLVLKLATPFAPAGTREDEKFRHAPVVCGYLEYDNTHSGDTAELVFGLDGGAGPLAAENLAGFSFGGTHGYATVAGPGVAARSGAEVFGPDFPGLTALHFTVPPGARRIFPLALGFHQAGFHYSKWFGHLTAVLAHGLAEHARYLAIADARDAEMMRSTMPFDAKARAALEVRVWLAQSRRRLGEPEVDLTALHALCRAVLG